MEVWIFFPSLKFLFVGELLRIRRCVSLLTLEENYEWTSPNLNSFRLEFINCLGRSSFPLDLCRNTPVPWNDSICKKSPLPKQQDYLLSHCSASWAFRECTFGNIAYCGSISGFIIVNSQKYHELSGIASYRPKMMINGLLYLWYYLAKV